MIQQFLIALDQALNTLVWISGDGFGMLGLPIVESDAVVGVTLRLIPAES